jgi:hypothetical protein
MNEVLEYGYSSSNLIDILQQSTSFDQDIEEFLMGYSVIPDDLTRQDRAVLTAYHRAAWTLSPQRVNDIFVHFGADCTIQDDCFGLTPLHVSVANPNTLGMSNLIMNQDGLEDTVKDRIMNMTGMRMVMWDGATLTFTAENFDKKIEIPSNNVMFEKYFMAWAKQCRRHYVFPLSKDEIEALTSLRCEFVFRNLDDVEEHSRAAAFQSAALDMFYSSQVAENPRFSISFTSRAAEQLYELQKFFTGFVHDNRTEDSIKLRHEIPWRENPLRWPHVFYMDRHGKCQFSEPLYEREEPAYRVWVVDEYGLVKGVLGAVDFD